MITDKQQALILALAFATGLVSSVFFNPLIGLSFLIVACYTTPVIHGAIKVRH